MCMTVTMASIPWLVDPEKLLVALAHVLRVVRHKTSFWPPFGVLHRDYVEIACLV